MIGEEINGGNKSTFPLKIKIKKHFPKNRRENYVTLFSFMAPVPGLLILVIWVVPKAKSRENKAVGLPVLRPEILQQLLSSLHHCHQPLPRVLILQHFSLNNISSLLP